MAYAVAGHADNAIDRDRQALGRATGHRPQGRRGEGREKEGGKEGEKAAETAHLARIVIEQNSRKSTISHQKSVTSFGVVMKLSDLKGSSFFSPCICKTFVWLKECENLSLNHELRVYVALHQMLLTAHKLKVHDFQDTKKNPVMLYCAKSGQLF